MKNPVPMRDNRKRAVSITTTTAPHAKIIEDRIHFLPPGERNEQHPQ